MKIYKLSISAPEGDFFSLQQMLQNNQLIFNKAIRPGQHGQRLIELDMDNYYDLYVEPLARKLSLYAEMAFKQDSEDPRDEHHKMINNIVQVTLEHNMQVTGYSLSCNYDMAWDLYSIMHQAYFSGQNVYSALVGHLKKMLL